MKKIILLLIIIFFSCKKETFIIPSDILLKEVSTSFFKPNTLHEIHIDKETINYTNKYSRLPNTEFSKFYLKKHPNSYLPYFNITLNLSLNNKITFEGVSVFKNELISYLKEYIDFASEGKRTMIHLNFNENIPFIKYYNFIKFIETIQTENIIINNNVFIYDVNSLPDCDCSL